MHGNTDELIRRLASGAAVRPLPRPWIRAGAWLAFAVTYIGVVVFAMTPRDDLGTKIADPRFVIEAATALATGVAASIAAFTTVVPGRSRKSLAILMLPLTAWLGSLGLGCVQDWITLDSAGRLFATDWGCFPAILLSGAVPTIAMSVMLRRGAPLTPALTMALGGLAAGALADFGMRFHHREAGVMALVWHLSAVFILLTVAGKAGPSVLTWRARLREEMG